MLVSTISGRPGTLRDFVNSALPAGTNLNITELRHRYTFMPQQLKSDVGCCTSPSTAAASWQPAEIKLTCRQCYTAVLWPNPRNNLFGTLAKRRTCTT